MATEHALEGLRGHRVMNWRGAIRVLAIVLNVMFAFWLFTSAAVWGPNDYVGGTLITIPPILAVIALLCSDPNRSGNSSNR